ncbi:Flp family type IVb pilin [Ensifer sp.]|uniref:Flp family type IVb pilin n=1 Tax=Ensifer sp. TaxID=1872086 RepID=UPI000DDAD2F7|nr:Flp family type IVb pilin [Ensifer sp.]
MDTLKRLFRDRSAATAVEYGVIAGVISGILLIGLQAFSDSLLVLLNYITDTIAAAWGTKP